MTTAWMPTVSTEKYEAPMVDSAAIAKLPVVKHNPTHAPVVPPATGRKTPARVVVDLFTTAEDLPLTVTKKYPVWTFNGRAPGPMIRARVGDLLEVHYTNMDKELGHNIDFHAVTGPGGGAPALFAEPQQTKVGYFKLLYPGVYVYHCAAGPVPMHVANGMYGLIYVEPEVPLPTVDKEFYVMQSEWYFDDDSDSDVLKPSFVNGLAESAQLVTFNGREGALTEKPLLANQGDKVRIFFGNGGPNLMSSFHVIGLIFDKVYRDADLVSPPARYTQVSITPPGGASVVEVDLKDAPTGSYTLVDHAIFRLEKGCVGFLKVTGKEARKDIYASGDMPINCPGCKLHN